MNNPAYFEAQMNAAIEANYKRECLAAAAEEVLYGEKIETAASEWGVSVEDIEREIRFLGHAMELE